MSTTKLHPPVPLKPLIIVEEKLDETSWHQKFK